MNEDGQTAGRLDDIEAIAANWDGKEPIRSALTPFPPDMRLPSETVVAAFNGAGAKVGQDQGRVAGTDREIGVIAQDCDSAATASQPQPDIGVVTMTNLLRLNMPAYDRLMKACIAEDADVISLSFRQIVNFLGSARPQ